MNMANILTIAGLDPSGGAGIAADLKVITLLGEVGLTVPTALTVQDSQKVYNIFPVSPEIIGKQLDILWSDFQIDAIKIGMIYSSEAIFLISQKMRQYQPKILVCDPIIRAKDGSLLLRDIEALKREIFPLSTIITPNIDEASTIIGEKIEGVEDIKRVAKELYKLGPNAILITGGHLPDKAIDILYDGYKFYTFEATKRGERPVHGTGCLFSTAIATFLAKEKGLLESIEEAKKLTKMAIDFSLNCGKGNLIGNPYAYVANEAERYIVIKELKEAYHLLQSEGMGRFIPEVRSNLVYALPYATSHKEVAGFPGRLTVVGGRIVAFSLPDFGVSRHMASVVLKVMGFDPSYRSAMNIKYEEETIKAAKKLGYNVIEVKRGEELPRFKEIEGYSLPFLTERAISMTKLVPDIIYDLGDMGKEPMIRIIGRTPKEVVKKVINLQREVN